jgi:rod shape-determining protein MreC
MMHPIQHSKRGFFGTNFSKTSAVISAIVVLILIFSIFGSVRSLASGALAPFFKIGNYFYSTFGHLPKFFSDKSQLITENEKLANELEQNRLDLAVLESVKYENGKLREELQMKPEGKFLTVAITARSPQIPLDTLLLNEGTEAGINLGDSVLAGGRTFIGKIAKVSWNTSIVSLNSFADSVSYGYVARTNEPIELKGAGGGLEARVPIDFDITVGDKIMSGGSVDCLIAVVGAIEEDRSSGFRNVLLSMPVPVSKINFVFIRSNVSL